MTVKLTGHILILNTEMDIILPAMAEHIRLSHAEAGCLEFNITKTDNQDTAPADMTRYTVQEAFTDQNAFDAHQSRSKNSPWAEISKNVKRIYPK